HDRHPHGPDATPPAGPDQLDVNLALARSHDRRLAAPCGRLIRRAHVPADHLRREPGRQHAEEYRAGQHRHRDSSHTRTVSTSVAEAHRLDFTARPPLIRRSPKGPVDDLILNVDALEEANQPFEADLTREFLDGVLRADPPTEFHAAGASHLRGTATKMGRKVLVQAKFRVPLT